ncbi:hypothetical protein [Yoonia sp.]|uniref:hypothetical protein n=1 Tax=Yoonia sp. TaxID=2212373 RepID=UPI002DF9EF2D|nr:hypothetical protein [Yoonia sp.]
MSKLSAQITALRRRMSGPRAAIWVSIQMSSIIVVTERPLTCGKWRSVEVLAYPVTFSPHPEHIGAARRAYNDWLRAPDWNRDGLIADGTLRKVAMSRIMPKMSPS